MHMLVSACLIVKNEERCLDRCLSSLKCHVDEIIVVDTGSSDNTVEIAKAHGASIYHFEWVNDFSAARNYSIDRASGKYVLIVDADEYVSPHCKTNLHEYILHSERIQPDLQVIQVKIYNLNELGEDEESAGKFTAVRILKAMPQLRYEGAVHEAPLYNGRLPIGVPIGDSNIYSFDLYHDGYVKEISANKKKHDRNLEVLLARYENGDSAPLLPYYLGHQYFMMDDIPSAKEYLSIYVRQKIRNEYVGPNGCMFYLKTIEFLKAPLSEYNDALRISLSMYPNHPALRISNANFFIMLRQHANALSELEKSLVLLQTHNMDSDYFSQNSRIDINAIKTSVACLLAAKGDRRALTLALDALEANHEHRAALRILIEFMSEDQEDLFDQLCKLYDLSNFDQVRMLLDMLKIYKPGIAYILVYDKYYQLNPTVDLYMYVMMVAVGEFKGAVEAYLSRIPATQLELYWFHAWAAAMCSRQPELMMRVMEHASDQHRHLLALLDGFAPEEVTENDVGKFQIMLTYLVMADVGGVVTAEWVAKAEKLGGYGLMQTAQTLERHGLHELELECLQKAKEIYADDSKMSGRIMVLMMKCCYAMGDYESAYLQTIEAYEHSDGYAEIGTYAQWLIERVESNRRKARLRIITDESNRKHIEYVSSLGSAEIETAEGDSLVSTIKLDLPPLDC